MPAHVTVLYPFLRLDELDETATGSLTELFARKERFRFQMLEIGWFGERTVYLKPEPEEPFQALTASVVERFPGHLPYRGIFKTVSPHVTVASRGRAAMLRHVARRVARRLPISAEATEVVLMESQDDGTWKATTAFPLGNA